MTIAELIRSARIDAGLSQQRLAERAGWHQPAVARLEREGSDPRLSTVERALLAAGQRLELRSVPRASIDEDQIARSLALTPAERLSTFEANYKRMQTMLATAERDGDAA